MSKQDRRMDRIYGELSATQRARLVLDDYKAGREPDERLRWTTPGHQWNEFRRLVLMLRSTNEATSWLTLAWEARLRELEAIRGWYATLRLWGTSAWETSWYLTMHDHEPITAKERDHRVADVRSDTITIPDLAEYLFQLLRSGCLISVFGVSHGLAAYPPPRGRTSERLR